MRLLIGRRGVTLDAIQYLASLAVNKQNDNYVKIILNTEGYREKREKTLKDFADKMAYRAIRTGRKIELEPMNPYERRIIHASLQNNKKITTKSQGEEPYRRIIIEPRQTQN
jgi:spoIIIJ-associated protein